MDTTKIDSAVQEVLNQIDELKSVYENRIKLLISTHHQEIMQLHEKHNNQLFRVIEILDSFEENENGDLVCSKEKRIAMKLEKERLKNVNK